MNQSNQPLVSVVIPCYNHESFVQDSIQSVIDQTYQNIELIIIDDGSKDGSVEKVQEMLPACKERFVRFEFRHRTNKGLSTTLNEALEWCQGEYLSPLASDDIFLKNKITDQIEVLEKEKNIVALFGGIELINENNDFVEELKIEYIKKYSFKEIILHKHIIYAPTQLIRMRYVKEVGGYKEDLIIEDWYMWLKLSKLGELVAYPQTYTKYRQHDNNTVKQLDKMCNGRFHVLSYFKDSKYYSEAMFNALWLNSMEMIAYNKSNRLFIFMKLFWYNPKYFSMKLIKRFFN
ncbi:hypothetical protein F965_01354 [Acinetobacter schindleri NIPH 900]|uniref:Glycosyltransferase 2-like domain-containing protein n=1 Tax=Acinetobacter schindleri NIPH 900 TaxID=1217675 RepID=N8Y1C9_9GAMM|nr:glycosyltransferase [Acinetobacter schindleri]ENV13453.1 hypothetical protein F965_01354 [Acinetobacter schindleri NIPH 900]